MGTRFMTRSVSAFSLTVALSIAVVHAASAGSSSTNIADLKCRDNFLQTPIGTSGQWSLERLLALTQEEGLKLWRSSPPPSMKEMNGHYLGLIPGVNRNLEAEEHSVYGGFWLGKAFKPISDTHGEGYNRFRLPSGKIIRTSRMLTRIGKSLVDGKPAYIIDYSAFDKSVTVVDEVRKLDNFIYLGIDTVDTGHGARSKPDFWVLTGPTDDWVGPDGMSAKPEK